MQKRIYNISLLVTSVFVYFVWKLFDAIDLSVISTDAIRKIVVMAIDFVVAYGFFHFFANILVMLSGNVSLVKRLILGSQYIEGVWVGYWYLEENGEKKPIFFKEIIEQTVDDIVISGEAYYRDRTLRCYYSSDALVKIDTRDYSLFYVYNARFAAQNDNCLGVTYLRLQHRGHFTSPERFLGYSMNLGNEKTEDGAIGMRVSKLPHKFTSQQLLDKAIKFYNEENTIN